MAGYLKAFKGFKPGTAFVLGPVTTIGRSDAANVVLPFDGVSRRHCVIALQEGEYVLLDEGSTNGTFVNGERVRVAKLKNGDRIGILTYELELSYAVEPALVLTDDKPLEVASLRQTAPLFSSSLAQPGAVGIAHVVEKVRLILQANEAIAQVVDPAELLNTLLEQLLSVLPAERGVVLLGRTAAQARSVAMRMAPGKHTEAPISRTVMSRLFDKREALLVMNVAADDRVDHAKSLSLSGVSSILGAPLVRGTRQLGAIYLDSPRIGIFQEDDVQVLAAIARQAAISLENAELLGRIRDEARMRSRIERYLPRELVDELAKNQAGLGVGTKRKIVVLFSDLRGFTALSSRLDASLVVETMNEYLSHMVDQIFKHGGTLDKFIGDAIMAFWGAPVSRADDSERAIRCALDMQASLVELNATRSGRGQELLHMGIGVSSGIAVVGNIGSEKRIEYTALGPPVNLASRIEGHAKGGEVLVSDELQKELAALIRGEWQPPTEFKGVPGPVKIFRARSMLSLEAQDSARGALRAQTAIMVDYQGARGRGTLEAMMKDLSLTGAGLLVSLPEGAIIDPSVPVHIALPLGDTTLRLLGQIRHHGRIGTDAGHLYRVGLEWMELTPEVRGQLEGWLAAGS